MFSVYKKKKTYDENNKNELQYNTINNYYYTYYEY